jgi:hypothetical protein
MMGKTIYVNYAIIHVSHVVDHLNSIVSFARLQHQ